MFGLKRSMCRGRLPVSWPDLGIFGKHSQFVQRITSRNVSDLHELLRNLEMSAGFHLAAQIILAGFQEAVWPWPVWPWPIWPWPVWLWPFGSQHVCALVRLVPFRAQFQTMFASTYCSTFHAAWASRCSAFTLVGIHAIF